MEMLFEIIKSIAIYGVPIISMLISILAYIKSRECPRIKIELDELQKKMVDYDLKLKKYELQKIEREMENSGKALVDARIIQISKGKYKILLWNCGDENAYNVDYNIPERYKIGTLKNITPFEILKPGCKFEEYVETSMESSNKYEVITSWENDSGKHFSNRSMRSL